MLLPFLKNTKRFIGNTEFNNFIQTLNTSRAKYVAKGFITQTGTAVPTVTMLANEIGTIVWTRTAVGVYIGTLAGKFLAGKVFAVISTAGAINGTVGIGRASDDTIAITTSVGGVATDGLLNNASFLIEIYA
jgi:hypothetical protein